MTSTYFCNEITTHKIAFESGDTFKSIPDLREAIIDNPWFGTSWQNDPTVDAMLNTLRQIHESFGGRDDLYYNASKKSTLKLLLKKVSFNLLT